MIQEVSSEKFNARIKKSIHLGECPGCGSIGTAQIRVDFPLYGKKGAYCRCLFCGYETKRQKTSIDIVDSKRYGTPTIEKSLMGAIRQAVNEWNGGRKKG